MSDEEGVSEDVMRWFRQRSTSPGLAGQLASPPIRRAASNFATMTEPVPRRTPRTPFKRVESLLLRTKSAPEEELEDMLPVVPRTRIFLTSNGLTTPSLKAAFYTALSESTGGKKRHEAVMAYIPTAKLAPSHKATCGESICEVQRRVTQLSTGLGVQVRVVDLAVTQSQDLEMTLTGVDCLYVEGGNTFWLLYHLEQSGFRELVRQMVMEQGILYVGKSAGAIVTGQTIATALWKGWDDPTVVEGLLDCSDPKELEGMGLLPCSVFPHFSAKWGGMVQQRSLELDTGLVCLSDGTGELWVDGVCEQIIDDPFQDGPVLIDSKGDIEGGGLVVVGA